MKNKDKAQHRMQTFIENLPLTSWVRKNQDITYLSTLCQKYLFTLPVVIIVILTYLWLVVGGLWTTWPERKSTNYYQLQAQSFRNGIFYLPIEPPPQLLKLSNPYDPEERRGLSMPIDLSLYKGKFYLYWGPAPALVIVVLKLVYHRTISDRELTLGFLCGTFLSQFLLILIIFDRFFQNLPKRIVLLAILLAGLAVPSTWMLGTAKVYEAAISGGQFFLVSGFLVALAALDRASPSAWRLALAGALWALAIGARNVLVLPIGFMVLISAYWLYKTSRGSIGKLLIALGLPLVIGGICLGWYNWARFGSITETGVFYSLGGPNIQKYSYELFSPIYIFQNLYNYLLVPFELKAEFPFIEPTRGSLTAIFPFYALPQVYFTNLITGLLCAMPFILFSVVPPGQLILRFFKRDSTDKSPDQELFRWIVICLTGCWLTAFLALLAFFWAAMRYMQDFMPALMILSLIGFWQGYKTLAPESIARKLWIGFGIALAVASILISMLLAISAHLIYLR